jgi:hypothetical protein
MTGALRLPTVVIRPRTVEVTGREAWMQALTRTFEEPDKTTRFPNGDNHVIDVLGTPVGLATFQPGWRWPNDVRPLMGTDSCPLVHVGYVLSGRPHLRVNDGSTLDLEAGELCVISSGHDAWVMGDEACRLLDRGGKVPQHAAPVDQSMGGTR